MRKLILITAMVLASAAAQAGDSRSLSLSNDNSATTTPAKPAGMPALAEVPQPAAVVPAAEAPEAVETPKYVDRPALVQPKDEQPAVRQSTYAPQKPVASKTASTRRAEKRRYWTERRIISELHRHGIYW